ncbi:MAG: DUF87 domain-containing protein [Firmicutes bacterium]|nr:DUF87 domain-containing protein [Bacillota bacterium]
MLGKIISIEENIIFLKLNVNLEEMQNIINLYVLLEDKERKLIGEIVDIKNGVASINLVGEFFEGKFLFGISKKPSFSATSKLISKEKINSILGMPDYDEKKDLYIGKSPIYDGVDIGVSINDFFSNHFAIFGSTGSGKSCSVARILQNLFEKQNSIAYKASILIFDAYGEYHTAFQDLNKKVPEISFKSYTTNTNDSNIPSVKIPLWLLTIDDIALLLEAKSRNELPIIEKAMKLVTIFAREESQVLKSKNDIIARALLDILSSGNTPAQIRDQIFSVLSHFNTKDLNLDTPIYQPGYTRPLKQCLLIDNTGKIREMELLTTFINGFLAEDVELSLPDGSFKYTLKDLYDAFEFALISEGVLSSNKVFDDYNVLKVRLRALVNSDYAKYFDIEEYQSRDQFIKEILTTVEGKKAQIINFNINYVDDRFAKTLTKIYSRIFFEYVRNLKKRASLPIHIVLEEAHRYVQNDTDIDVIGYNIFDRITKEGRKYAILLGLISQRPSELSTTALSQCSNFLIFKMLHPTDVEYIRQMVPNITVEILKKIKLLQPGTCIAFGSGFKLPSLIKLEMPNPAPSSNSCDISGVWFIDRK